MPSSPLDRYVAKHGHPLRAVVKSGKQRITLEISSGYVRIRATGAGQFTQEIYIPRRQWWKLLRWAIKPSKLMDSDFDVEEAQREYLEAEREHIAELRRQKKERGQVKRRRKTRL